MQSIIQPTQLTAVVRPARLISSVGASGDVRGPGSATDGQAALFDGPSGRRLRATPTGAVGLALLARSALTAGSLLLGAGAGAPTELATTSYGRSFLGLADPAAGRSLLQLGASDSPTFAGLGIGVAPGAPLDVLMGTTGRTRFSTDGVNGTYLDFISADAATWNKVTARATQMSFLVAASGAPASGLVLTPSAPGTAGAGEVRVGGGQINAAGSATFGGRIECGTADATEPNYGIRLRAGVGIEVCSAYKLALRTGGVDRLLIDDTGAATFGGIVSCAALTATAAAGNNARVAVNNAGPIGAGGYNGYEFYETGVLKAVQYWDPSAARVALNSSFAVTGTAAPGTAGANEVRIGAGGINAAGNIIAGGYFALGAYVQPRSTATLVNVGAATYADIYTLVTNDLVQVTIGNATDGYAASAIIAKASTGSPVIVRNDNTDANLTISLSGDNIRINNGVGSTRTIIYCLTRLYG